MEQQTAVESLVKNVELISNTTTLTKEESIQLYNQAIEQAKEMHKEQMIKFTKDWYNSYWQTHPMKSAEKFYNEIFKNK